MVLGMVWVTDDGLEKACISRPGQLLHYRRDRRASTDVDEFIRHMVIGYYTDHD